MDILTPSKVWSREQVLATPSPVPRQSGLYGWYFKSVPAVVPMVGCVQAHGLTLLYVGIAPKAPPANGKPPSRQSLWHRIRYHHRGNAEGSTLRLTLGCLLAEQLGIQLRRVGNGTRMTFADGEHVLSQWMADNAYVAWQVDGEPWVREEAIIASVSLPLNLDMNRAHPFLATLSEMRSAAKAQARKLPVFG